MKAKIICALFCMVFLVEITPAFAVVVPDFRMTINNGVGEATIEGVGLNLQSVDANKFSTTGTQTKPMWEYNWNLTVDPDPSVGGTFDITNLTGVTRTFSILFDLPTSIAFAPGVQSGFLEGLLEDTSSLSGFGASGAFANNVLWNGRIDGIDTLGLGPFSPSCSGAGCSDPMNRQDAGPDVYGPGVVNDIGIGLSFDLSPGDKFSFMTEFEVQPVPLPASLPLFAAGLVGLLGFVRRGKAPSIAP